MTRFVNGEADVLLSTTIIESGIDIPNANTIIIDDATVLTGSFNFSKAAEESNAENLVVIKDTPAVASRYVANYNQHKQHAEEYAGPTATK